MKICPVAACRVTRVRGQGVAGTMSPKPVLVCATS
jgi:hypothetical protein